MKWLFLFGFGCGQQNGGIGRFVSHAAINAFSVTGRMGIAGGWRHNAPGRLRITSESKDGVSQ